jgi:hypothetical protein
MNKLWAGLLILGLSIGCEDAAGPPSEMRIDGVIARTEMEPYGGGYRVFLNIHNDTQSRVNVNWAGPCLMKARLYRGNRMVFDGITAYPICANDMYAYSVAPSDTYERIAGFVIDGSVRGDSIPAGEYRIVAALRPQGKGGPIYEITAGTGRF